MSKFYIYIYSEEKEYGPFPGEEIIELLYEGNVDWGDAIRGEHEEEWSEMGDVFDLQER